jgi:hypothetical protein
MDAAWKHARECATCGPALEAATALTADLAALPQPGPPPELSAAVLARIEQAEQAQPAGLAAAVPATRRSSILRQWSAQATVVGSLVAGLVIALSIVAGDGARSSLTSPRVGGLAGLVSMPSTIIEGLVLGAGLLLYAAGLFAPLRGRDRASST